MDILIDRELGEVVTIAQAGGILGISRQAISEAISLGRIRFRRIDGRGPVLLSLADVRGYREAVGPPRGIKSRRHLRKTAPPVASEPKV